MSGDAFQRTTFRGRLMDRKTAAFLAAMEAELGYELTVVQGCYNPGGVGASGGTHDDGGVVDLAAFDAERKLRVAVDLGGFGWHRAYLPGVWGEHLHIGIRDHGNLSPAAARQQGDFDGTPMRDGLAYHRPLTTYRPTRPALFVYPVKETPVAPKPTKVTKARDSLVEAIHALGEAAAQLDDADPSRAAARAQINEIRQARRGARAALDALPQR